MPRVGAGSKGNRTDLLSRGPMRQPGQSRVGGAGQPNGRPQRALVPTGLPYGEHQQLTRQIAATPKALRAPGPATPPAPTTTDYTQPGAMQNVLDTIRNRPPRPAVTPMNAPTERPDEPVTAGSIGQPDSVLGGPQPGQVSTLLSQIAMLTGSAAVSDLAQRAKASGV